ncbi:MAG TPA: 16S rRNA (adenine(1518)-N(6)/adenine(1519)-N(6))-dimethyltransferase, partial [Burkholderiaceae bacterium]
RFAGAFDVQRRAEEVPVSEYLALAAALGAAGTATPR